LSLFVVSSFNPLAIIGIKIKTPPLKTVKGGAPKLETIQQQCHPTPFNTGGPTSELIRPLRQNSRFNGTTEPAERFSGDYFDALLIKRWPS